MSHFSYSGQNEVTAISIKPGIYADYEPCLYETRNVHLYSGAPNDCFL